MLPARTLPIAALAVLALALVSAHGASGEASFPSAPDVTTLTLLALLGAAIAYSLTLKHLLQLKLAERLEIEKHLRDSEAEYRALIDKAPFPIVMTRMADNTIVFANRRLLEQFGLRAEQLLGKPAENNYENPEDRRRLLAILKETGQVNDFETCLKLHNGLRRWVYVSATISRFNDEEVMFLSFNDITERNELANAMRATNDHLVARLAEIQGLQEQLREQAIRDVLTGLYNRRYLDEVLDRELARAMREGHPLTVMMLDLDHFKKLNDTYGHPAGDEVLKALGDMLRHNARTEDIPCRYGGEEFLLVLPNMHLADARVRAEQLREKFAAMRIVFGQFAMTGTLSVGIATFPGHGRTRDELIDGADQALYAAKHNGRNRVEVCPDAA